MKDLTDKISITIGRGNHANIKKLADKLDRSKSKTIDLAITEFLQKHT